MVGAHGVTRDESVTDARLHQASSFKLQYSFNCQWLLFGAFGCSLFCLLLLRSKTGFCVPPIYIKPEDDVARVLLSIWVPVRQVNPPTMLCIARRSIYWIIDIGPGVHVSSRVGLRSEGINQVRFSPHVFLSPERLLPLIRIADP